MPSTVAMHFSKKFVPHCSTPSRCKSVPLRISQCIVSNPVKMQHQCLCYKVGRTYIFSVMADYKHEIYLKLFLNDSASGRHANLDSVLDTLILINYFSSYNDWLEMTTISQAFSQIWPSDLYFYPIWSLIDLDLEFL